MGVRAAGASCVRSRRAFSTGERPNCGMGTGERGAPERPLATKEWRQPARRCWGGAASLEGAEKGAPAAPPWKERRKSEGGPKATPAAPAQAHRAARQRWVLSGAHTHPADGRARPPAQKRTPRTRARARVCARSGLLRRDATRVGLSARPAERGRALRARWLTWQLTQLTALRLRGAAQQRVRKAGHRVAGRSAAAAAASGAAHQVTQPGHCCVGCGVSPQSHESERHAAATSAMR